MKKVIGGIGFVLFLIGAGTMDSMSFIIPAVMLFAGLGMFYVSMKGENNDTL